MPYRVGIGFDNDTLADIDPQPKQPNGIQYPQKVYGGRLNVGLRGTAFTALLWTNTIERDTPQDIAEQFGLSLLFGEEIPSSEVTIELLDNDDNWIIVNAVAEIPDELNRFWIGFNDFGIILKIVGVADVP